MLMKININCCVKIVEIFTMRSTRTMDLEQLQRDALLGRGSLLMKKLLPFYLLITLMARIGYQRGYNHVLHKLSYGKGFTIYYVQYRYLVRQVYVRIVRVEGQTHTTTVSSRKRRANSPNNLHPCISYAYQTIFLYYVTTMLWHCVYFRFA